MYIKRFENWNILKIQVEQLQAKRFFREKEFWWCILGENIGAESCGKNNNFERPVLVFKKLSSDTAFVLPLTSIIKEGDYYCTLELNNQLRSVMLHQGRFISTKRFVRKIEKISDAKFDVIKQAYYKHIGIVKIEDPSQEGSSPVPNGKDNGIISK
jgi:mRNA-degrading endonuclease toxin of MazEF toxin-antitoxin module